MRAPGAQIWLPTGEVDPIEVTMELFKWRQFEPEVILPAAVAFVRRKTSRWFLLCAGSSLLIGGALNWWGLLPIFSWNG
jgi:hypothetical protein